MSEKYFKNEHIEIWITSGILFHRYAQDLIITLDIAKEITKERIKMSEGNKFPLLVDARTLKYISKDAREYWSTGDGIKYLKAGAFIIGNSIHRVLGNFYLKINRPPLPARLFKEEKSALEWLQQYKLENYLYYQ